MQREETVCSSLMMECGVKDEGLSQGILDTLLYMTWILPGVPAVFCVVFVSGAIFLHIRRRRLGANITPQSVFEEEGGQNDVSSEMTGDQNVVFDPSKPQDLSEFEL